MSAPEGILLQACPEVNPEFFSNLLADLRPRGALFPVAPRWFGGSYSVTPFAALAINAATAPG
jgi:hypothetical protein